MQFRTVSSLEGEQLDAVIVPVFKEGDAAASTPSDLKDLAEWVAKESGQAKLFSANTHLMRNGEGGMRLVVVSAGSRDEFDVQRAWQVASAGVRSLWQSTATRVALIVDSYDLDDATAVQSAVEGVIYAMWRPEAYRTGPEERKLPPLEEVLLVSTEFATSDGAR